MKRFVLLIACGLASIGGCQNSGHEDVDTGSHSTAAAAPAYTMPYQATRDTEWTSSTDPGATKGTVRMGDRVMFTTTPNTGLAWQQAKLANGHVRWVRPADYRAAQ